MKNGKERFMTASKKGAAGVTLSLWMGSGGAMGLAAQGSTFVVKPERQVATVQSKFYCNIKALTTEERLRHKQLTEKLMAARKEIVETEKGYEFQYRPADVALVPAEESSGDQPHQRADQHQRPHRAGHTQRHCPPPIARRADGDADARALRA